MHVQGNPAPNGVE